MLEIKHEMDWIRMWAAIGAQGDPSPPYQDLRRRYAEPQRKYYTWKHIVNGLEELRLEYAHVDEQVFKTTRADILGRLLLRPQIFSTPYFFDRYENQAVINLSRSIKRLKKKTT